jgi:aryl-alcohol dehydrogenase-like predicted oxidoreductase
MGDRKCLSKIGLGCVTFGREIDQKASFELMDYAVAHGIHFFDTAAVYGKGASEEIIGAWLKSRSAVAKNIVVATKILLPHQPESIARSVDESLQRLKVDAIDLLYLHNWHISAETPDTLFAFDQLIQKGKVKALGASNFNGMQLSRVLDLQIKNNFSCFRFIQNNHNLAVSNLDRQLMVACKDKDISVVTYSPLGAGFLTGKHKRVVQPGSRFDLVPGHQDIYFNEHASGRLQNLETVAKSTGHSAVHLALAWALHQPAITSVLVGARHTGHLEQALAASAYNDPVVFSMLEADNFRGLSKDDSIHS